MFHSKTVFILGAGASREVNLPDGEDLKKSISSDLSISFDDFGYTQQTGDRIIYNAINSYINTDAENATNINQYIKAANQISQNLPLEYSIDNLLFKHKDDEHIQFCGKLAIVKNIINAERKSTLFFDPFSSPKSLNFNYFTDVWYSNFIKKLTEQVALSEMENIFQNVDIISFNYDRCFEHFVFEALKQTPNLGNDRLDTIISGLNVYHPYGSIGNLPWQRNDHNTHVSFGSDNINLLNMCDRIKTFDENIEDEELSSSLKKIITNAEIIVFLGFAFHEQNLEILQLSEKGAVKKIYATAYGISASDIEVIEYQLRKTLKDKHQSIQMHLKPNLKCNDLFLEYRKSIGAKL